MLSLLLLTGCAPDLLLRPADTPTRLVRLTATQWEYSVEDLLALSQPTGLSDGFVADPSGTLFKNDGESMVVSPTLWQEYQLAAETLARQVVEDSAAYDRVVPTLPNRGPAAGNAQRDAWIASFGRRAFRRDLSEQDLEDYRSIFEEGGKAFASGDRFMDGVRACLVAFLQSPYFLYRVEAVESPDDETLGSYELASKLSFALQNAAPSPDLLDLAEHGFSSDVLAKEAATLLQNERGHAMLRDFHRQLMQVDSYQNIPRPYNSGEDYGLSTPAAMQAEVDTYIDSLLYDQGTLAELLTGRHTYVDAQVADIYGIDGVDGRGETILHPVDLDPAQRNGLITLSGFLAYEANGYQENLIARGAFVNTVWLCVDLPPPPAAVPPLDPPNSFSTARQRVENQTAACGGSCHNDLINPLGFAFGNYDYQGRYQTIYNMHPINSSGSYTFADGVHSFNNAVDLADLLAGEEQVHHCYISHLASYLYGRNTDAGDEPLLSRLTQASLKGEPVLDLVQDLVNDDSFRKAER